MGRTGQKGKRQKNKKYKKHQKQNKQPLNKKSLRYAKFCQNGYRVECWIIWENGKPYFLIKIFKSKTNEPVKEVRLPPLSEAVSFSRNVFGICVDDHEDLVIRVEQIMKELPDLNKQKPAQ